MTHHRNTAIETDPFRLRLEIEARERNFKRIFTRLTMLIDTGDVERARVSAGFAATHKRDTNRLKAQLIILSKGVQHEKST